MSYAIPSLAPIRADLAALETQTAENIAATTPAGTRWAFAMDTPPAGWLVEDGSEISRTDFADLFAAIGTIWGAGDGATTFNLPDTQHEFERGAGPGRAVGLKEGHSIQSHSHNVPYQPAEGLYASGFRYFAKGQDFSAATVATGSTGSAETRPRNVAVLKCIKF